MRARFYGGPLDGKTMILPDTVQTFEVPVLPTTVPLADPITASMPLVERVTYQRQARRKADPPNLHYLDVPFVVQR